MRRIKLCAVMLAALAAAGCASVAEGTVDAGQPVLLTSEPSGATVRQDRRRLCQTPCRVRQGDLRYGEPFVFEWADGRVLEVDPSMRANASVLGNVIVGGGVGVLVDVATGRAVVNAGHVHAVAP